MENALIQVVIAVSATAIMEYPEIKGDGKRYELFVKNNTDLLILAITEGGLHVKSLSVGFPIEKIVYKLIRCCLIHEGELPVFIEFSEGAFSLQSDKIIIPKNIVIALIIIVMGSRVNFEEKLSDDCEFFYRDINVNDFWGKRDDLLSLFYRK